jgi:hypothetical protein
VSTSTIVAVAEAIGSIVDRVKTPSIDWKQRALEAEEGARESDELLEFITRESEAFESQLSQVAELLAECGAPRHDFGRELSALDRAEWLKRKTTAVDSHNRKPRSTISEIIEIYDAALERADGGKLSFSSREVVHQAILAVVEHVRKEIAEDPVSKSVASGDSAYTIRNFNELVSTAIGLAGGKPGTVHLFDAIEKLALERDMLHDTLEAERRIRTKLEERFKEMEDGLGEAEERAGKAEAEAAL